MHLGEWENVRKKSPRLKMGGPVNKSEEKKMSTGGHP
jgi:hypothetical protein